MRLVSLVLVAGVVVACSDKGFPEASDASSDATTSPCSPDCTSGQLCFASGPPDAAPPSACQFVPSACTSDASCDCLGSALCPGAGGYTCNYDALAGYAVLQCDN